MLADRWAKYGAPSALYDTINGRKRRSEKTSIAVGFNRRRGGKYKQGFSQKKDKVWLKPRKGDDSQTRQLKQPAIDV
ncbi:hypothetical protein D0T50_11040 [Bacteroides sp. 214]|nr:hypothetical protein [Bacteroides sp. 214]